MTKTVKELRQQGLDVMASFAGEDYAAKRAASTNGRYDSLRVTGEVVRNVVEADHA